MHKPKKQFRWISPVFRNEKPSRKWWKVTTRKKIGTTIHECIDPTLHQGFDWQDHFVSNIRSEGWITR